MKKQNMNANTNTVEQFIELQKALREERETLTGRIAEIDKVLGSSTAPAAKRGRPAGGGWKRQSNELSLREAVEKVTSKKPLTKDEIMEAVAKIGYKFGGTNPMNRLNTLLYGKSPKFANLAGRFQLAA